jgi:GAF domain-containing protein
MTGLVEPVARAALDAVPDGVCILAEDWTIQYLNPAGAAILERSVDELTGRNLWEEFPRTVGSEHHACLLRAASNPPGADPERWSAYYEPVRGWFSDQAWRVGDQLVLVFCRTDETREAEAERQRLAAQLHDALARSQVLLAASEAFTAATTMSEISGAVANLVSNGPQPPEYVDIALLEPDGRHLTRLRSHVLPVEIRERYRRIPLAADQPAAECVRSGRPVFVENLEQLADRYPALHADWAAPDRQATACVPVPGLDGPLGALVFVWARPQTIDVTEQAVITTLAGYAGHAVSRLRALEQRVAEVRTQYEDTRAAMSVMQRTLLPHALPVMPGLRIAAHYRAADSEHTAGGDWFDAIPVGQGRVALAVGDVVGHGAAAAAVMGQLRAVLNGFLVEGADAGEALARLDRFVSRVPGARGATAWVGVLDSRRGLLRSVSRRHPPPMVLAADGRSPPRLMPRSRCRGPDARRAYAVPARSRRLARAAGRPAQRAGHRRHAGGTGDGHGVGPSGLSTG